jgi:hypothetical protein
MKVQSIVVALAGALLAAGSVIPASASPALAASPRSLCLTAGEVNSTLGGTFKVMPGTSIGNMGPGIYSLKIVKKAGLVKGYGITYTRQHPGETMVLSGVNLFRSTAFATASVDRVVKAYGTAKSSTGVRAATSHDLGDASAYVTFQQRIGHGAVLHGYGIIFSRGRYAADVMVYSTSTVDHGKVLSLSKSVDTRIKSA